MWYGSYILAGLLKDCTGNLGNLGSVKFHINSTLIIHQMEKVGSTWGARAC